MNKIIIDKLVRSRRRSISLQITPDATLVVRAPWWVGRFFINRFVTQKSNWIRKKQAEAVTKLQQAPRVQHLGSVEQYKKEAYEKISTRVQYFATIGDLKYNKIKIGSAKSRWGSCGANGNLNFPWRLALVPPSVIDYVVVHELSHLEHKNHSQKFWMAVAKLMPEYKQKRRWLRENGHLTKFASPSPS